MIRRFYEELRRRWYLWLIRRGWSSTLRVFSDFPDEYVAHIECRAFPAKVVSATTLELAEEKAG